MSASVHLNVFRHPVIPVPRGRETFAQAHDPAFRERNDDVDALAAPRQVRRAACALELDPALRLQIWHSDTRRNRRAAPLWVEAVALDPAPRVLEVPELGEPAFELRELVSQAAFEDPARPPSLVRDAYLRAVVEDNTAAVAGGRAEVARRVLHLRERLSEQPPHNLLWLTHGLLMPFLYLTLVEGVAPDEWQAEHVLSVRPFSYAEGFSHRVRSRAGP